MSRREAKLIFASSLMLVTDEVERLNKACRCDGGRAGACKCEGGRAGGLMRRAGKRGLMRLNKASCGES